MFLKKQHKKTCLEKHAEKISHKPVAESLKEERKHLFTLDVFCGFLVLRWFLHDGSQRTYFLFLVFLVLFPWLEHNKKKTRFTRDGKARVTLVGAGVRAIRTSCSLLCLVDRITDAFHRSLIGCRR